MKIGFDFDNTIIDYSNIFYEIGKINNLIPENTPNSIAAGIIYFISQLCNLNISKKDVNTVTSISEVTINKCFKKLEQIQTTLIPKSIYDKYVEK